MELSDYFEFHFYPWIDGNPVDPKEDLFLHRQWVQVLQLIALQNLLVNFMVQPNIAEV